MVQELMVMETPSPQSVGLQFVQQYYTMLNKAPQYLHRFYSSNSSFLRGGLDSAGKMETTVQGQPAIHNKIMELNFRDCHTKIVMVDSQVTLGEGVVVQVSGELSNNGQPLRRFMQTFVLALQSPKQYYVQNDILRYQDEVFPDDDDEADLQEGSGETEGEEEQVELTSTSNNIQEPTTVPHYFGQLSLNNGTAHVEEPPVPPPTAVPAVPAPFAQPSVGGSGQYLTTHSSAAIASTVGLSPSVQAPVSVASAVSIQQSAAVSPEPSVINTPVAIKHDYRSPDKDMYPDKSLRMSPELPNDASPSAAENEPKTYATMVSRKSVPLTTSPVTNSVTGPPKTVPGIPTNQSSLTRFEARSEGSYTNSILPPQPQRPIRPKLTNVRPPGGPGPGTNQSYSMPSNERINSRGVSEDPGDMDRRRPILLPPDDHQIFVGNLPHDVTDDNLRDLFSQFGKVLDVRINNKATPKPNFGFIVFDSSAAVQLVISSKPITYGNTNHRLNVEEKKRVAERRSFGNDMSRLGGPRLGGSLGRGGSMMGGRGGGMGGRGGGMGGRGGGMGGGGGGMSRGGGMGGRGGYFSSNNGNANNGNNNGSGGGNINNNRR